MTRADESCDEFISKHVAWEAPFKIFHKIYNRGMAANNYVEYHVRFEHYTSLFQCQFALISSFLHCQHQTLPSLDKVMYVTRRGCFSLDAFK